MGGEKVQNARKRLFIIEKIIIRLKISCLIFDYKRPYFLLQSDFPHLLHWSLEYAGPGALRVIKSSTSGKSSALLVTQ